MSSLTVVLPAFNEEAGIAGVLARIAGIAPALSTLGLTLDILVVDDGSEDRTAMRAAACDGVRVVRHPRNAGYGAALKTGFRLATGDLIAFLDADGTYPPESLPALCEAVLASEADLAVGSRMSGARTAMPMVRRVGNAAYAGLLTLIGGVTVRDTSSGMRVVRRSALERLYPLPDGLAFTPAMSTRAIHENLRVVEVPIPYDGRVGQSKLSVVRDGLRFTRAIVWTALSYNPVRVLGAVAVGMVAAAAVLVAWMGARAVAAGALPAGAVPVGAIAGVLGATGVSLFVLGAMFNYLVSLLHQRPVRQGLFGRPIFVPPLDHHFGWMGIGAVGIGLSAGVVGVAGMPALFGPTAQWLLLFAASLVTIVGVQLGIAWIVMRVLEELATRTAASARDRGTPEPEVEVRHG